MEDKAARRARKEEAKRLKRKRIEEAGGVRPRKNRDDEGGTEGRRGGGDAEASASSAPKQGDDASRNDWRRSNGKRHQQQQKQRHRFGRVMSSVPCPNRPRRHTLSIAVPGSIMSNCQTRELRTQLVGQIARAAAVYHVDEIVVFDDKLATELKEGYFGRGAGGFVPRGGGGSRGRDRDNKIDERNKDDREKVDGDGGGGAEESRRPKGSLDPHAFMARILQYCECPQYLRRHFFPMHPDLQFAGMLSPLDAPHHVRAGERSRYREGVVLKETASGPRADKDGGISEGSLVNCGIRGRPVLINRVLTPGIRCTVRLDQRAYDQPGQIFGNVVSPTAPREEDGTYWGYTTRLAASIKAVFDECPFEGGYDLKVGTSERGDVTVDDSDFLFPKFRHSLVVFGGVAGIEECVDADESLKLSGNDSRKLFDMWVNTCPYQGSRTIRTEEAVLITLARFRPFISRNAEGQSTLKCKKNLDSPPPDVQFSDEAMSDESSEGD